MTSPETIPTRSWIAVYRYYRCRSHAGGRPPCPGVSVLASEIEGFVRQLIGRLGESDRTEVEDTGVGVEQLRAFSAAWSALAQKAQCKLLSEVLDAVAFDQEHGQIEVRLKAEAVDRLVPQRPDDASPPIESD